MSIRQAQAASGSLTLRTKTGNGGKVDSCCNVGEQNCRVALQLK
jgi:hypothetical protein